MMTHQTADLHDLMGEALTPGGTRRRPFDQMIRVLEAGLAEHLVLFSVDVTNADGTLPYPEWMFRLTDEEAVVTPGERVVQMALKFYRDNAREKSLSGAAFEVFFMPPD